MSHNIEFNYAAIKVDRIAGLAAMQSFVPSIQVDEYERMMFSYTAVLMFVEHGDNNTICNETGKVARRWDLRGGGTDPLYHIIDLAHDAEAGHIKPLRRDMSAENYIAMYRRHHKAALDSRELCLDRNFVSRLEFTLDAQLLGVGDDNYVAQRYREHPYTAFLKESGQLTMQKPAHPWLRDNPEELVLNVDNSNVEKHLAALTWLIAVAGTCYKPLFSLRYNAGLHNAYNRAFTGLAEVIKHQRKAA